MTQNKTLCLAVSALALLASCGSSGGSSPAPTPDPLPVYTLGDPIVGLSQAETDAFTRGKVIFEKQFKPSKGLGPLYNATSCSSCHSSPIAGGSSKLYRNFYLARAGNGGFQRDLPGLPSPVVPAYGGTTHAGTTFDLRNGRFVIPEEVFGQPVLTAQRNGVPLFGVGLFEFITDETIMGLADPDDDDGDGISGRFNTDAGALGRFGVKAQSNNIELFTRAPLQNQMGITSNPFLGSGGVISVAHAAMFQASTDPNLPLTDDDEVPDPEISSGDLGDLIAFTRFLAPPSPKDFNASAAQGEMLFESLGCTGCHVPEIQSSRGRVRAYSDILLHDMGPELADGLNFGIPQFSTLAPTETASEYRTQPLWGVGMTAPFLHDGRAETLEEAITLHGGEAATARDQFLALTDVERADVIAFLEHL